MCPILDHLQDGKEYLVLSLVFSREGSLTEGHFQQHHDVIKVRLHLTRTQINQLLQFLKTLIIKLALAEHESLKQQFIVFNSLVIDSLTQHSLQKITILHQIVVCLFVLMKCKLAICSI